MDTKAAFVFVPSKFGLKSNFLIEFDTGRVQTISGGRPTKIDLDRVGSHRIRASIDGYMSNWTTFNVADGDLVQLIILPPSGKMARAFGLLMGKGEYLTIKERNRDKVC